MQGAIRCARHKPATLEASSTIRPPPRAPPETWSLAFTNTCSKTTKFVRNSIWKTYHTSYFENDNLTTYGVQAISRLRNKQIYIVSINSQAAQSKTVAYSCMLIAWRGRYARCYCPLPSSISVLRKPICTIKWLQNTHTLYFNKLLLSSPKAARIEYFQILQPKVSQITSSL